MVIKSLILFALLPLLTGVLLRKFCYRRSLNLSNKNALLSGKKVCEEILSSEMEFDEGKDYSQSNGLFLVPSGALESKKLSVIRETLMAISLAKLSGKSKITWIDRERSILKFNMLVSVFTLIICLFGILAKSLLPLHTLYLILIVIGLVSVNSLYLTMVRRQAAQIAVKAAKSIPFLVRKEDQSLFYQSIKENAYQYSIPLSDTKWRIKIDKKRRN